MPAPSSGAYDYIVVGSGAGGGTLAARLAEAGMNVLLLEAGADPGAAAPGLPQDYDVPAFHPFASENPAMTWNFFVRDFGDDAGRRRNPAEAPPGALYPRASALGGCTAHNAMIWMVPPDSDWDTIANLTKDESWRGQNMRRHFRLIENCRHRPFWRSLALLTGGFIDPTGHGWGGWLETEVPRPLQAFGDPGLISVIRETFRAEMAPAAWSVFAAGARWLRLTLRRLARLVIGENDPNDARLQGSLSDGLCEVPLSTSGGRRRGARERVLAVAAKHRLTIEYNALATHVLLDADKRAVGVEFLKGATLYRASPLAGGEAGVLTSAKAQREVILCCGAFNTPQLLMLSGIGPPDALAAVGVATQVALEGVGRNLQDRYELGVVHKKSTPWACLQGARFEPGDPLYDQWRVGGGMYVSNGAAVAFAVRSGPKQKIPDIFVMALLTRFTGYFPGYSNVIRASRDDLTFTVLKARTKNRGGIVTLASCDPRDAPRIDFNYFEYGTDKAGEDLAAVVEGVTLVRRLAAKLQARDAIGKEDTPGPAFHGAALRQYIREHAWGHHACGTCAIGPREAGGVLTSDFRVHGTTGLRVVDASVFPRILGFFIACAVYMIGEKAAEAILSQPLGPVVDEA